MQVKLHAVLGAMLHQYNIPNELELMSSADLKTQSVLSIAMRYTHMYFNMKVRVSHGGVGFYHRADGVKVFTSQSQRFLMASAGLGAYFNVEADGEAIWVPAVALEFGCPSAIRAAVWVQTPSTVTYNDLYNINMLHLLADEDEPPNIELEHDDDVASASSSEYPEAPDDDFVEEEISIDSMLALLGEPVGPGGDILANDEAVHSSPVDIFADLSPVGSQDRGHLLDTIPANDGAVFAGLAPVGLPELGPLFGEAGYVAQPHQPGVFMSDGAFAADFGFYPGDMGQPGADFPLFP